MQVPDNRRVPLHPFFTQVPLSYAAPLLVLDAHKAVPTTGVAELPLFQVFQIYLPRWESEFLEAFLLLLVLSTLSQKFEHCIPTSVVRIIYESGLRN